MSNMFQQVDLPKTKFIGYTRERLQFRHKLLTEIITSEHSLDVEIVEAAGERREIKAVLEIFEEMDALGVETEGLVAADILEEVSGKSIEQLQKETVAGQIAQDAVDKSKNAIRGFGNWLSSL